MNKDLFETQDPEKTILEKRIQELKIENSKLKDELKQVKKDNKDLEFLRPDKTFGIAVCGDVLLNKLEVKIVNSPSFQRLRKIKQLGSTYLVFPSANHNRFEHSLGVLKAADTIIRNITTNQHSSENEKRITPEEEQIIRLLALLHDIGHMSYGHTFEDEFGIFRSHDKHETRWEFYLGEFSEIGQIIIKYRGKEFHRRFFNLIKCEKKFFGIEKDAFMYDIVSNTVCADLLDYLERDCFYTNLQLRFHPRFLNYFFIKNSVSIKTDSVDINEIAERRIAIRAYKKGKKELRRDIISELIQLLRNRYYLGERVYYHHAKIKTGTLLAGAVARAHYAGIFNPIVFENEEMIKRIEKNIDDETDKKLYNIHLMGDEELVSYLLNLNISKLKLSDEKKYKLNGTIKLAKAYDKRIKYSEFIYRTKDDLGIEDEFDTNVLNITGIKKTKHAIATKLYNRFIKYGTAMDRLTIEDQICEYLDMDSGDILIYCPNFNMAMKLAKAKIEDDKKEIHELREFNDKSIKSECQSIIDKHQALWALRVFVNPKYIEDSHDEYIPEYEDYKDLIKKYCDWTILAKDESDEEEKGKIFWNSYIDYILAKFENDGFRIPNTSLGAKKQKSKELVDDLVSNTFGTRAYNVVLNSIIEKFAIVAKNEK